MQIVTLIVKGAPHGTEGPYNAFRLAGALLASDTKVNIFLMSDTVFAAKPGHKVPQGYYNAEKMLSDPIVKDATVRLCTTCCKARGITSQELTGAWPSAV